MRKSRIGQARATVSGFRRDAVASLRNFLFHLAKKLPKGPSAERPILAGGRGGPSARGGGGPGWRGAAPNTTTTKPTEEVAERRRGVLNRLLRERLLELDRLLRFRRRGAAPSPLPVNPARWTPPAIRPWPVRGRPRGAARQNHRLVPRAAPTARPSPAFVRQAHRPRRGASRVRRAIDRCPRKTRPAAGWVRRAAAAGWPGTALASGVAGSVGSAIGPERAANRRVTSRST